MSTHPRPRRRAGRGPQVAALVIGVLLIVAVVVYGLNNTTGVSGASDCVDDVVPVHAIIGSEKRVYFEDSAVKDRLRCLGFTVDTEDAGSLEMAKRAKEQSGKVDVAFPGSDAAADNIKSELRTVDDFAVFSSPMVIVSDNATVAALRADKSAEMVGGVAVVRLEKIIDLVAANKTWADLVGDANGTDRTRLVLRSTNPAASNSGLQLLALAAVVVSGDAGQVTPAQVPDIAKKVCPLFWEQGGKQIKSDELFREWVGQNSRIRLAFVYEAQYLAERNLPQDNARLYPNPGISSVHRVIAFTDAGKRFGGALRSDKGLADLMIKHGFRPMGNPARPSGAVDTAVTQVTAPTFEVLHELNNQITTLLDKGNGCPK
ncbi:hypothetical protein [Actinokineospora globicatena]|uniref:Extracellular solute-binding protein n=1 Tax=Actinokineospora globicatena TaxID=103729 RepID=A0A9W6QJJ2_9PSEU|nr:hypothetical protein [Actinokineospora globicatena]GLW89845.1 hypothetical protein Aglo03_06610 [Actinokineospora globicatena]